MGAPRNLLGLQRSVNTEAKKQFGLAIVTAKYADHSFSFYPFSQIFCYPNFVYFWFLYSSDCLGIQLYHIPLDSGDS